MADKIKRAERAGKLPESVVALLRTGPVIPRREIEDSDDEEHDDVQDSQRELENARHAYRLHDIDEATYADIMSRHFRRKPPGWEERLLEYLPDSCAANALAVRNSICSAVTSFAQSVVAAGFSREDAESIRVIDQAAQIGAVTLGRSAAAFVAAERDLGRSLEGLGLWAWRPDLTHLLVASVFREVTPKFICEFPLQLESRTGTRKSVVARILRLGVTFYLQVKSNSARDEAKREGTAITERRPGEASEPEQAQSPVRSAASSPEAYAVPAVIVTAAPRSLGHGLPAYAVAGAALALAAVLAQSLLGAAANRWLPIAIPLAIVAMYLPVRHWARTIDALTRRQEHGIQQAQVEARLPATPPLSPPLTDDTGIHEIWVRLLRGEFAPADPSDLLSFGAPPDSQHSSFVASSADSDSAATETAISGNESRASNGRPEHDWASSPSVNPEPPGDPEVNMAWSLPLTEQLRRALEAAPASPSEIDAYFEDFVTGTWPAPVARAHALHVYYRDEAHDPAMPTNELSEDDYRSIGNFAAEMRVLRRRSSQVL